MEKHALEADRTAKFLEDRHPTRASIAAAIMDNLLCRPSLIMLKEDGLTEEASIYVSLRRLSKLTGVGHP